MNTTLKQRIEANKQTREAELNLVVCNLTGSETELSKLKAMVWINTLHLYHNQIQDISFLKDLVNLNSLHLWGNQIQNISLAFLENFPKLTDLGLSSNPLKYIPNEVVNKDNCLPDLKNYLLDLEKGKSKNNEVKIVFIGNGSVGKTQVAKRLQQANKFIFEEKHDSTHGISILEKRFDYKIDGINEVQANLWDFGGQDIYHATHRLFMGTSKNIIYAID